MSTEDSLRFLLRSTNVLNAVPNKSSLYRGVNGNPGAELAVVHKVEETDTGGATTLVNTSAGLFLKVGYTNSDHVQDKVIRIGNVYVTEELRPDQLQTNNQDMDYTGALWYRLLDKTFRINLTGQASDEAWAYLNFRYTNLNESTISVGGIAAGTIFNDVPLEQLLTDLFYPYKQPTLTTFTITPDPTVVENLEIGEPIPPPGGDNQRYLELDVDDDSNLLEVVFYGGTDLDNLIEARNAFVGGFYSGVGKDRAYVYTQAYDFTFTSPTTYYWGARVKDTQENFTPYKIKHVNWKYRSYVCSTSLEGLTDPTILSTGITSALDRLTEVAKAASEEAEYIYIFLPVGRTAGTIRTLDGYTPYVDFGAGAAGGKIAMRPKTEVVLNRNGVQVIYEVYRTAYPTHGDLTIYMY
jgi:hypothetical protein